MRKKQLKQILGFLIFLVLLSTSYLAYDYVYDSDSVKIANWNLQIFGQSKASDLTLMNFYKNKIKNYDIIFIQEIRDSSETAFPQLCSSLQNYSCKISSRAGRSSSKEQYGIIYKKGINITSFQDFNPDSQDRWERPPIKVSFNINNYKLTAYNIHTKPDDVQLELNYLEDITENLGNVLILGDLNADCTYYNNEKETEFDSWNWIIKDTDDTTTAQSSCAYDRIILNTNTNNEFLNYGINSEEITKDVSDHYLVWVELKLNE